MKEEVESAVEKSEKKRLELVTQPISTAANVQQLLELYREPLERLAPKTLDVQRMMRIAVMIAGRNPRLREATGLSLIGAVMMATQMGLDIGMGLAHLVPFRNKKKINGKWVKVTEVQLIPDYKGLIELVTNTGKITAIRAVPVFEEDLKDNGFVYEEGATPKLEHRPKSRSMNPDDLYAVYSVARYPDGFLDIELMFRNEIELIHARSKAADNGPWTTDYIEMSKKTVIKRHCKRLPKSIEMITAIGLDDRAAMGAPQKLQIAEDATAVDLEPMEEEDETEEKQNTGSIDMQRASAGDQTPPEEQETNEKPLDPSLFPPDTGEVKLISKALQVRIETAATQSGWKLTELRSFLESRGILEGKVSNIPAGTVYDGIMMAIASGGDPEDEGPGEESEGDSPAEEQILRATEADWAKIRKAAKASGRSDKEVSDFVKTLGVRLMTKLPKSMVPEVLSWALGD